MKGLFVKVGGPSVFCSKVQVRMVNFFFRLPRHQPQQFRRQEVRLLAPHSCCCQQQAATTTAAKTTAATAARKSWRWWRGEGLLLPRESSAPAEEPLKLGDIKFGEEGFQVTKRDQQVRSKNLWLLNMRERITFLSGLPPPTSMLPPEMGHCQGGRRSGEKEGSSSSSSSSSSITTDDGSSSIAG